MTIPKPSTNTKPSDLPPPTVVDRGISAAREIVRNRQQRSSDTSGRCCARLVYVFVGLVLLGFACSGLILYRQYDLDRFNLHTYHDGDQVRISDASKDLNSVLCQAYAVSSSDRTNVYQTVGKAKISPDTREVITIRNPGLKAEHQYDYRAFYLLPGSSISVSACMRAFNEDPQDTEVLFFKGDKPFNHWRNHPDCHHCAHHSVVIPHDMLCERGQGVLAELVIEHKDTYYVVITRQQRSQDNKPVIAEIDMQVIKTMYDISNVKAKCMNAVQCKLNLTYASDDDVIVEFAFPEYSHSASVTYFTTACELRRTFWIAVFGLAPTGLVGLFLVLLCLGVCLKEDTKKKSLEKQAASKLVFALEDTSPQRPGALPV